MSQGGVYLLMHVGSAVTAIGGRVVRPRLREIQLEGVAIATYQEVRLSWKSKKNG